MTPADPRRMTEEQLLEAVLDLAGALGWYAHHDRPARTADGKWRTAIQGDRGFPDLCLAHPRHGTIFRELKDAHRPLEDDQRAWLEALANGGADAGVWRPKDWRDGTIERRLRGRVDRATDIVQSAFLSFS